MPNGYIGARRPEAQQRWFTLLDAALNQPQPTPELQQAILALKKQTRGKYLHERKGKDTSHAAPSR